MKELWIEIPENIAENQKEKLLAASQNFADVLVVSFKDLNLLKGLNKIIAGDFEEAKIRLVEFQEANSSLTVKLTKKDIAARINITTGKDESKVIEAANLGFRYVVLGCKNWKIIPLENIIAKLRNKSKILMEVSSPEEAKLAIETLQLGADGVVYKTDNPESIEAISKIIKNTPVKITLVEAEVFQVKPLGMGARVCIDTCDLMNPKEGVLVGSQSSGLFLVESETIENPHVEPRPFRVNAGPVASYLLVTPERTRYLSEIKSGDEVMIVNSEGNTRMTNICRVKIEWRPMIILEVRCEGRNFSLILQNAETVRIVTKQGSKSVSEIKQGDKVLAKIESGGRHFGTKVDEEAVIER